MLYIIKIFLHVIRLDRFDEFRKCQKGSVSLVS